MVAGALRDQNQRNPGLLHCGLRQAQRPARGHWNRLAPSGHPDIICPQWPCRGGPVVTCTVPGRNYANVSPSRSRCRPVRPGRWRASHRSAGAAPQSAEMRFRRSRPRGWGQAMKEQPWSRWPEQRSVPTARQHATNGSPIAEHVLVPLLVDFLGQPLWAQLPERTTPRLHQDRRKKRLRTGHTCSDTPCTRSSLPVDKASGTGIAISS